MAPSPLEQPLLTEEGTEIYWWDTFSNATVSLGQSKSCHTDTHTQTFTLMDMLICIIACTHATHTHTRMHACTHTYACIHTHIWMHACTRTYKHTTYICIQTHARTPEHTALLDRPRAGTLAPRGIPSEPWVSRTQAPHDTT